MSEGKKKAPANLKTEPFRASFVELFEKKAFEGGVPKYSMVMLFPKDKLRNDPKYKKMYATMKAMVEDAINEKWPNPKKRPEELRSPFRDGDKKEYDGYADHIFITASSQKLKPKVLDQNAQPIMDPDDFYSGCYAVAMVNCYAYQKAGNAGVAFGVLVVQKYADGQPFGAAVSDEFIEQNFAPIESVDPEYQASEEDLVVFEDDDDLLG